ncbi:hypothetical protein BS78_K008900 [Paspalum vaginatum]|uniref:FHA domain-containing protein n=1 Tax=Paspalum vaginatum TaxID=158149 RepID=A0A9W7XDB2_9POAL|nr:hypothetical protein BS78_K008900 [Paspalum vaginatum]
MASDPSGELMGMVKEEASGSVPAPQKAIPTEIGAVAGKLANQPIHETEGGVWAVLTAVSKKARLRPQGTNILLSADEHWIGRTVDEDHFQISHPQISGKHCKIYKDTNCNDPVPVFLKDTSSNGTRINFKKAQKNSPLVKLKDGDIISFTWPPHNDDSYVFVYREFNAFSSVENGAAIHKRKPEGGDSGNKRLKGLDIGSPDGPDDIRSLGKSKAHLREQLEAHVTTIETLRDQIKMAQVQHGKELEELRETASSAYLDETKTLRLALEEKQKQLDSLGTSNTGLQNYIKDLEEKLSASKQSISRKKAIIHDLGRQLSEEMKLRMEHEKAAQDLKSALHKVQYEEEEIKRQTESYLIRLPREQTEAISKLKQDAQDNVVTFDIKKEVEELTLPLDRKPKQFDWVSELDRESQVTIKHHWEKLGASNKSKAEDGKTISRSKCLQAEGKNIYAAGTTRQELEAEGDCVLQLVVHDLNRA